MITSFNCFEEYLLNIEPGFKPLYYKHTVDWDPEANVHSKMIEFSHYIGDMIETEKHENLKAVFNSMEFLLNEQNADEDVKNAVCTCFLENLINAYSDKEHFLKIFIPLLGPNSKEYCKAWDEFTGTKTPGLWEENEKPKFRSVANQISDSEALMIIGAIKNRLFKNSKEEEDKIKFLEIVFPGISNLLFYDRRNLTPDQILKEIKKIKKVILP